MNGDLLVMCRGCGHWWYDQRPTPPDLTGPAPVRGLDDTTTTTCSCTCSPGDPLYEDWITAIEDDGHWCGPGAAAHGVSQFTPYPHQSRGTDPTTSDAAAEKVLDREGGHQVVKDGTHKARLLVAYGRASRTDHPDLTDAKAAEEAGLGTGGWKRCSDLRSGGFIRQVGETQGEMGTPVMTCELTTKGRRRWAELDPHAPRDPAPDAMRMF